MKKENRVSKSVIKAFVMHIHTFVKNKKTNKRKPKKETKSITTNKNTISYLPHNTHGAFLWALGVSGLDTD